ncbi:MarR family winged helix-turn-helix transcriptional regulator [Nocardioides acrostichi]|uniref:Winged helix-turn-helix transcriptional regulator n=1 Tax=Nocardioides acrostichi TaxID=2784339 RepID=A0A930UY89_9ACTN|nr:MarR family winged helix-turn-helix transcriptional regulator [Nocardioides acrostichi]MBF4160604.1 winged helix-turn-helix transcriptional regulator [Nocardioides acrostichi]
MDAPDPIDVIHDQIIRFSRNARMWQHEMYGELSFVAYAVLTFVAASECAHAADLAAAYGLDKSTVSRQIGELVGRELLERSPDPRHARMQRLEVTTQGKRVLRAIRRRQRRGLAESLAGWPPEDIETFSTLFARFVYHLDAATHEATTNPTH